MNKNLTKHCGKCGRDLPISYFWKNINNKDGLQNYCKDCLKAANAQNWAKRGASKNRSGIGTELHPSGIRNAATYKIAKAMKNRLKELGLSQLRFIEQFPYGNRPTLRRILLGYSASTATVDKYLGAMGLEFKIVKKNMNDMQPLTPHEREDAEALEALLNEDEE